MQQVKINSIIVTYRKQWHMYMCNPWRGWGWSQRGRGGRVRDNYTYSIGEVERLRKHQVIFKSIIILLITSTSQLHVLYYYCTANAALYRYVYNIIHTHSQLHCNLLIDFGPWFINADGKLFDYYERLQVALHVHTTNVRCCHVYSYILPF